MMCDCFLCGLVQSHVIIGIQCLQIEVYIFTTLAYTTIRVRYKTCSPVPSS